MSREVNIKKYKFFKNTPPKKRSLFKQVKGLIKIFVRGLIFDRFRCLPSERENLFANRGCKTALPVQTSERSFYNAEINEESKTRMGFFHKSRSRQKNIQQPLP